ncbi:MAG: two component transcriptional regulator, LuxR family [Ramlibacter sp.]|jgi:two-component system response regulator NreC|nr:two component transcriptional regulator, LuxR family [Ramlibacter sp.]MDB5914234.1 two component transcriptional regulator, LuxR family [Ramlibacter sp.]
MDSGMSKKHHVFIVDDHALLRAGLVALLSRDPSLEIVGEAEDGQEAVRQVAALLPDLVLMDVSMPGMSGIEAVVDIKRRNPQIRVLVLTIHKADEYVLAALRAGADGYILKDATQDELRVAIRSILHGKMYLSPDISGKVVHGYLNAGKGETVGSSWDTLTHREREVLKLIAEGHPNKYISNYFCLSIKTVEKHRSNLMRKLNLHNASVLTSYAIEKGLVSV